jgi:hypothetical protein
MGEFEVTIERSATMITLHAVGPVNGKTPHRFASRCWRRLQGPMLRCASIWLEFTT